MEPVSKGLKVCEEMDRISNLPPDLIGNILSFLPTKEAVATSVLSTKWKCFWTFITRLEFVESLSFHAHEKDRIKLLKASFTSFVYRVLFYRKPTPLNYLGLNCRKGYYASHVRAWVSAVLPFGLKELDLSMRVKNASRVLPSDLFSCKTLVKLRLRWGFRIDVPPIVCLPCLEVVTLTNVAFPVGDSLIGYGYNEAFRRFLLGCPSLQELNMTTFVTDGTVLHIDAPMLSHLTICFLSFDAPRSKMILDTPSLKYLKVNVIAAEGLDVTDLSQLVEADISDVHIGMKYQVTSNLISALSKVQTLHLCGNIIEVITKHGCKLPKFHNLTTLKLGVSKRVGWALLPYLLGNSPVLETLVFLDGLKKSYVRDPPSTWSIPQKVPYCLIHHLRLIQVNHFEGDIEEEEMFKYFIENRGVVKDLTIQYSNGSGDFWDVEEA